MKKFFSLVAIAAVAATMFTSCSKNDDNTTPPGPGTPKLTLSVDKATVAVGAEGTYTITSDIEAPADIVIGVSTGSTATLTVNPASVTIAKGSKTATGKFTGVADGKTKITIEATNVTLSVGSVDVTVGDAPVDLPTLLECDEANNWSGEWLGPEETFGFTLWYNGGVMLENLGADYYGSDLALTAVEKGTEISTLTLTKNLGHITMGSNSSEGYDQLPNFSKIGAAQYIVFSLTDQETDDHNVPQVTGWALVSASDNGNSVILHEIKFPATKVGE